MRHWRAPVPPRPRGRRRARRNRPWRAVRGSRASHHFGHHLRDPVDDRLRRAERREQALPVHDLEIGEARLLRGRHVRQSRIARGAGDRQCLELAIGDRDNSGAGISQEASTCLPSSAATAGAAPRNGICEVVMPVRCSSNTSVRWLMVPGPDEATLSLPGLALASAMKVRRSDAGRSGRAHQHLRRRHQHRHRRELPERVLVEIGLEARIHRDRVGDDEQRVAIGRRIGDEDGAGGIASPGLLSTIKARSTPCAAHRRGCVRPHRPGRPATTAQSAARCGGEFRRVFGLGACENQAAQQHSRKDDRADDGSRHFSPHRRLGRTDRRF